MVHGSTALYGKTCYLGISRTVLIPSFISAMCAKSGQVWLKLLVNNEGQTRPKPLIRRNVIGDMHETGAIERLWSERHANFRHPPAA